MKITKKQLKEMIKMQAKKILNETDNSEELISIIEQFAMDNSYEFVNNYSGRNMYGKECVGFICEDVYRAIWELGRADIEQKFKTDNMGHNYIIYFPYLKSE